MRPHIICHMLCSVDGKIDGTSLKAVIGAGEYPRVEIIPIQKLDEAYEKVLAGEVKFRYVIDMSTLA